MEIPAHEHHVRLTLLHSEVNAAYGLRPSLAMALRVPYDIKQQRVRYTTLEGAPYTPPYGDIHHRSETLRGVSDGDLLLLFAPSSQWHAGVGTTLPLGKTVEDPIALGREGKKHEHIQFGSGVLSPEFEVAYSRAALSALVQATIPVATNDRGFRAPRNLRWTVGPTFNARGIPLTLDLAGQYQSVGRWHGEPDEATGFSATGLRLQAALPVRGMTVTPSIYRELSSHGLNDETFSQGTTLGLTITRRF